MSAEALIAERSGRYWIIRHKPSGTYLTTRPSFRAGSGALCGCFERRRDARAAIERLLKLEIDWTLTDPAPADPAAARAATEEVFAQIWTGIAL